MNATEALNALCTDPLNFLRTQSLTPSGSSGRQGSEAGIHDFSMLKAEEEIRRRPGSIFGSLRSHRCEQFKIRAGHGWDGGILFRAMHLPVQMWSGSFLDHRIDRPGVALMITTQLSGCCVLARPMPGGGLSMAHVRPASGQSGRTLQGLLRAWRMFEVNFGALDYDADNRGHRAAVVAVRSLGEWGVYAQLQDDAFNVREARRLL